MLRNYWDSAAARLRQLTGIGAGASVDPLAAEEIAYTFTCRLPRTMCLMLGMVEGRRGRGRPRSVWRDEAKKAAGAIEPTVAKRQNLR